MFVVTGLHTKRRPRIGTDKPSTSIRTQGFERLSLLPAVPHSHRRLHPAKLAASSPGQATPRISESRMARNNGDTDACNRNVKGRQLPIKVPPGRVAPPRVRRFIPKPLILVERMKARQLLLDSSPSFASESRGSLTLPKAGMISPPSTHMTPQTRWIPTCGTLSSDSNSSSSISIRVSLRNGVVFGSGFGMVPRPVRPLSVGTLADSSSSTDTFVADSPCYVKQASKVPLLVTATDVTNVHLEVESDPGKKIASHTSVPVLVDSVAVDFVHPTRQSTDAFDPAMTSTPSAPSHANTNGVPAPITFITSTVYPPRLREHLSDSFEIVSPTSRVVYPFSAPEDACIVKLPNSGSVVPKPAPGFRRLPNRGAPPSPTLVLDGVFALPRPSLPPSTSSRRTPSGFSRPRKPLSRRPLSDISNAPAIVSQSYQLTSPTPSRGPSGAESPRSKLAYVLTANALPQTTARVHKQARVPPLVKGVEVSHDPRTQCEIEGLRVRRVVGLDRGGDGGGRGAIERMSLAGVGMVARLRARWEAGTAERCGSAGGCA